MLTRVYTISKFIDMLKETKEVNFRSALPLLEACRKGEAGKGYNLWVHASIYTESGGTWNTLGTTHEEVRSFLVEDLKSWIQRLRTGSGEVDNGYWDLIFLNVYFTGEDVLDPISHEELGITPEEIKVLEHSLNIRAAKEELERCRLHGPTERFWGVKNNLLEGTTKLEDIGADKEEIDVYAGLYSEKFPYSGWRNNQSLTPEDTI